MTRTLLSLPGRFWRARRRVAALACVAVVTAFLAIAWGVGTATADSPLGPHLARYDVTLGGDVVVDLGPLGTLRVDSPLPAGLGVRIVVGEIPAGVMEIDPSDALGALSNDARGYVQFFSDPDASLTLARHALVRNAIVRASAAWVALLGAAWLGALVLGARRRRELARAVRPRLPRTVALLATTAAVALSVTASGPAPFTSQAAGEVATVFDGTPLEGARITGRLAGVIDTYGALAVKAYRDNQGFYSRAEASLVAAWQERASVLIDPLASAGADGRESTTLLVVSDLHCNTGMAALIHRTAVLSGAEVIVNAGDSTIDGTAVESVCVDAFAGAAPGGTATVVVDGNHDSGLTAEQERAAGATVLTGQPVTVQGIRFLGAPDPRETRLGSGTSLSGTVSPVDLGDQLASAACEAQDIDILLIHDPSIGDAALEQGCVPLQISGHLHQRLGPEVVGGGVRYISASTAGAVEGQATIGPLRGVAEMTVMRFDPETRQMLDRVIIRILPDGHAEVGYPVFLPSAGASTTAGTSPTAVP